MYQVGSTCYTSGAAAAAASASSQVGSVVERGGELYTVSVSTVTDTAIGYTLSPVTGGTSITYAAPYTAQPCGLFTHEDALELSWLVVAAWASAWAIVFLTKVFRNAEGAQSHDT